MFLCIIPVMAYLFFIFVGHQSSPKGCLSFTHCRYVNDRKILWSYAALSCQTQ